MIPGIGVLVKPSIFDPNGRYMLAAANGEYLSLSTDYGATWQAGGGLVSAAALAINTNGAYAVAGRSNASMPIFYANNYLTNWNTASELCGPIANTVAISSSGQYAAIGGSYGSLLVSSNYGASWTTAITGPFWWTSVNISSTGQYMVATTNESGYYYTSSNYGVSWSTITTARFWKCSAINSTGQYMIVAAGSDSSSTGQLMVSSNYGASWTAKPDSGWRKWLSVSINSPSLYGEIWPQIE
jgi:hypothetical protein